MSNIKIFPNYFELFEIDINAEIDEKQLYDNYLKLQTKYHPDNLETEIDPNIIIEINQGFEILKNPIKRYEYILNYHNIPIGDEANSLKPSNLLVNEIIELREELENIQNKHALESFNKLINLKCNNLLEDISKNFKEKNFEKMAHKVIALKYYYKIQQEIIKKQNAINSN